MLRAAKLFIVSVLLFCAPRPCWGREMSSSSLREVRIVLVGKADDNDMVSRVGSWFPEDVAVSGHHQVQVTQEEVFGFDVESSIGAWLFLRDDINVVYLASNREGERHFLRRDLGGGHSEEALESLAQAVHYLVMALWEGTMSTQRSELEKYGAYLDTVATTETTEEAAPVAATAIVAETAPSTPGEKKRSQGELNAQRTEAEALTAPAGQPTPAPQTQTEQGEHEPITEDPEWSQTALPLLLGGGYGMNVQTGEPTGQGPEFSLLVKALPRLWLGALGRWLVPTSANLGSSRLRSQGAKLAAMAVVPISLSSQWDLVPMAGVGLDIVSWENQVASLQDAGSGVDVRPILLLGVGPRLNLGLWRLSVNALLDTHLTQTRYVVKSDAGTQPISTSGIVAPGATPRSATFRL